MNSQLEYYKHLASIMYATRGCRFTAAKMLKTKEMFSIGTISFLSIYLIGWSVASASYPDVITSAHARFFNAVSVVASVGLLALSIFDFALSRSVTSEKLNRNALEISQIMRELERHLERPSPDFGELERIAAEYERMIIANEVNHSPADYRLWLSEKAKPRDPFYAACFYVRRIYTKAVYLATSAFMHLILVALVILPTLWYLVFRVMSTAV